MYSHNHLCSLNFFYIIWDDWSNNFLAKTSHNLIFMRFHPCFIPRNNIFFCTWNVWEAKKKMNKSYRNWYQSFIFNFKMQISVLYTKILTKNWLAVFFTDETSEKKIAKQLEPWHIKVIESNFYFMHYVENISFRIIAQDN